MTSPAQVSEGGERHDGHALHVPPAPYPWLAYIVELEDAAENDRASFAQTFMAMYLASNPQQSAVSAEAHRLYQRLLGSFQSTYGNIIESRYGDTAAAGAVLLSRGHETPRDGCLATDLDAFIWEHFLHFDSSTSVQLLADVLALRDRITTFLPAVGRERVGRDIALRRLFGIARELIENVDAEERRAQAETEQAKMKSLLAAGAAPAEPSTDVQPSVPADASYWASDWNVYKDWVERETSAAHARAQRPSEFFVRAILALRERLTKVETIYLASVQRLAQREYVGGMFSGLAIVIAPAVLVLAAATALVGFDASWVAAMSAGAIGALLSVLQRIGRGPLDLGPEGDRETFRLAGNVRPAIGAVLGVAGFVLIEGGLVAIAIGESSGTTTRVLYYAGIAFLAGFSERFARDILVPPTVGPSASSPSDSAG